MSSALALLLPELLKQQDAYKTESPLYLSGQALGQFQPYGPQYSKLSPLESLLAGALSGLGGGVLKGIAQQQSQSEQAPILDKLTQALAAPGKRDEILGSDPELAPYKSILGVGDAIDQRAMDEYSKKQELDEIAKVRFEPKDRNLLIGPNEQQQHQTLVPTGDPDHPYAVSYVNEGQPGPRFAPPNVVNYSERTKITDPNMIAANAQLVSKVLNKAPDDPQVLAISADRDMTEQYIRQGRADTTNSFKTQLDPRTTSDIAENVSTAQEIKSGLDKLHNIYQSDPSLIGKTADQLPFGSDAYNAFKELELAAAKGAKIREGRVTQQTLDLYTGFMGSLPTEPLDALYSRGNSFINSFANDARIRAQFAKAGGKNTDEISKLIDNLLPNTGYSQGGSVSSSAPSITFEEYKARKAAGTL